MPKSKKKGRKISMQDKEIIQLLSIKGNSPEGIAEYLELPLRAVNRILAQQDPPEYLDDFKTTMQEEREEIEEFERVLKNKKDGITKGAELWAAMKQKHKDYKKSWVADSVVKFNFKDRYICVACAADFHIGHEGVDLDRLENDLRILSATPNMYMAFLGDSIDNFIDEKHKEAIINAVTSPKEQLYMLLHLFKNILKSPSHKILFATKDNHVSQRSKRATGIDWSNKLWSDMNVFYGGEEVFAELKVGKVRYTLLGRHKYRGKSNIHLTASCKNLLKNGMYEDVDIVALAHNHEGAIENFSYRGRPRVAAQTSTYKLFDPFAAQLGFHSPAVYMPCVVLSPNKKEFITCSSIEAGSRLVHALNKGRK